MRRCAYRRGTGRLESRGMPPLPVLGPRHNQATAGIDRRSGNGLRRVGLEIARLRVAQPGGSQRWAQSMSFVVMMKGRPRQERHAAIPLPRP